MKRGRFTNTALPTFSGAECWFQHLHIIQAIIKSNGWSEETAALQLFAHLKGEALNVALLLPKEKRESWTGLVNGLSVYYRSPGRLAWSAKRALLTQPLSLTKLRSQQYLTHLLLTHLHLTQAPSLTNLRLNTSLLFLTKLLFLEQFLLVPPTLTLDCYNLNQSCPHVHH